MKILIVDDEALVRAGMRVIVPWEEYGYYLVGEATNGIQALDMAREFLPDIILVDIVMPEMDGLDFIREINKELPTCKFIILSCMNEISYYKKAITLGVSEYILKSSVNPKEILEVVGRVADEIRKERVYDTVDNRADAYANKNVVLNEFLNMVFKGKIHDPVQIGKKLACFSVGMLYPNVFITAFSTEFINTEKGRYDGSLDYSIVNLCQEIINSIGRGYIFINYEDRICALVSYQGSQLPEDFIQDIGYRIRETIRQCLDLEVTLGFSGRLENLGELRTGYSQAISALELAFFKGRESIITYRAAKPEPEVLSEVLREKDRILNLQSLLDSESMIGSLSIMERLLMSSLACTPEYVRKLYLDILYHLLGIIHREKLETDLVLDESFEPLSFINGFTTLQDLNIGVAAFISRARNLFCERVKKSQGNVIDKISKYIDENMARKISLGDIAGEVHLNPDYVCRLFKKETGQNLVDYMLAKRIEKSKELLTTGANLCEIIEKVGFSSESYFIKMFKSLTGVTPGQYVKQKGNL